MKHLQTIVFALMLASMSAYAKAEVRLGAGLNCGVPAGDGVWEQANSQAVNDDCGNSLAIQYIGNTGLHWLDYMAGLSYRKGSSITHGQWVTDDCYNSMMFSGGREVLWFDNKPKAECDVRFRTALIESTSRGIMFALVPTYKDKDWSVYTSIGLSYFQAVTKIEWDKVTWPNDQFNFNEAKYHKLRDTSVYMDVGFTYKRMFVTAYFSPNERGGEAPNSGNYGLIAGYRF